MKTWIVGLLCALALTNSASAGIIAAWNFEVNTPADVTGTSLTGIAADIGAGTAQGSHASAATQWTTPAGNGSANSLSSNNWAVGDYYQFDVNTLGEQNIYVTWDHTSSSTGPGVFNFAYRIGNTGNFTTFLNNYTVLPNQTAAPGLGNWSSATGIAGYGFIADLTGVSAVNNQQLVQFRLSVATDADATPPGTIATTGTSRIDNFTVAAIPEPSSMALFGLAVTGAAGYRLRRRRAAAK